MHTRIPLLFQIWQYSEFDTCHANSLFILDIPNLAFSNQEVGYANITQEHSLYMYAAHSECVSQLGFLRQSVARGLLTVYAQLYGSYGAFLG